MVEVYSSKKKKPTNRGNVVFACVVILFILACILIPVIDDNSPRNYYMAELKVADASVAEKYYDGSGNYHIRISTKEVMPFYMDSDNLWLQVTPEFFNQKNVGSDLGVLLGRYDIYKKRYWGLFGNIGQDFEKNYWGIEEIYSSYAEAQAANPYKKYTAKAVLKKKKETKDKRDFFVLQADERSYSVQVDNEVYNKHKLNDEIECEFESLGDLVKILAVKS